MSLDLGCDFSKSVINEEELKKYRHWVKAFRGMDALMPTELDDCLVLLRDSLIGLYHQSAPQIQMAAQNAGFLNLDKQSYCQGARVFFSLFVHDCKARINEMEMQQAVYAEHVINIAERAFEQLSPYHEKVLANMRSMPN